MLIVEDGSLSTPSANTYATQSYVATYCSDHGLTEWAALASDSLEEQAIHRAMSYLEGLTYKGYKVEYDQPLRWPRGGVYDEDGYLLDDDSIPPKLLQALAQASYEEVVDSGVLQKTVTGKDFITSERVDVIAISYEPGHGGSPNFTKIDKFLLGFLKSSSDLERV
jgi:hypothetical protein